MPTSDDVSTKLRRVAELAKQAPDMAMHSLSYRIDVEWLREAYRRTRKDGATGVDGQSADEYAANLEDNLQALLDRAKSGLYRAPPVRRVHIPKGDGKQTRPIGIPTFEDKVLQRAVVMLLEAVYEQDFYDFSYGFRPGRSAHQALERLRDGMMSMGGGWVLEVDIRKFFDSVDRSHLREVLHRRVRDGVLLRLIGKWLNAGVLEGLVLSHPDRGTPQGGVISPLLANVFLHDVVDHWFATEVQPRLRGRSLLVRYADDMVFGFEREDDARRVMEVLPKRFGKYGLTLHPEKTRLLKFERPADDANDDDSDGGDDDDGAGGGRSRSFNFLGFTHYWARSRAGRWVIKRKTAKDRLSRALRRIWLWCRGHRHEPMRDQQHTLAAMMRGHYAYFGITANYEALRRFARQVERAWWTWLTRRSQHGRFSWAHMKVLLARFALPRPRIVHCYT